MTVAIILIISSIYNMIAGSQYNATTYSDFIHAKQTGNLKEVEIRFDRVIYLTKEEAAKPAGQQKASYTGLPAGGDLLEVAAAPHPRHEEGQDGREQGPAQEGPHGRARPAEVTEASSRAGRSRTGPRAGPRSAP